MGRWRRRRAGQARAGRAVHRQAAGARALKIPLFLRTSALMAGVGAKKFAVGWANGMVRHQMRNDDLDGSGRPVGLVKNPFSAGTVEYAASEASVSFMR